MNHVRQQNKAVTTIKERETRKTEIERNTHKPLMSMSGGFFFFLVVNDLSVEVEERWRRVRDRYRDIDRDKERGRERQRERERERDTEVYTFFGFRN